jgi:hypothetical protein
MATQNVWTYSVAYSNFVIDETFGLTAISILCTENSVNVSGLDTAGGYASSFIRLTTGQTCTISTLGSLNSLQIVIDATGGVCNIMGIK